MSVDTSPRAIQNTLDEAITSVSRSRLLRMIDRLHRQHEARYRKAIVNERREAYQLAKHRKADAQIVSIFKTRYEEARGSQRERDDGGLPPS